MPTFQSEIYLRLRSSRRCFRNVHHLQNELIDRQQQLAFKLLRCCVHASTRHSVLSSTSASMWCMVIGGSSTFTGSHMHAKSSFYAMCYSIPFVINSSVHCVCPPAAVLRCASLCSAVLHSSITTVQDPAYTIRQKTRKRHKIHGRDGHGFHVNKTK